MSKCRYYDFQDCIESRQKAAEIGQRIRDIRAKLATLTERIAQHDRSLRLEPYKTIIAKEPDYNKPYIPPKRRLGYANPCSGNRAKKYRCYKKNMKIFHENVFGYWKQKRDLAKTKLKTIEAMEKSKLTPLTVVKGEGICKDAKGDKAFKKQFCKGNVLKPYYKKGQNFKKGFAYYKAKAKKAERKAEKRFIKEFKAYKVNSKFFRMNFLKNLKAEQGELGACIKKTHIKEINGSAEKACFYSDMDIAQCLSDPKVKVEVDAKSKVVKSFLLEQKSVGDISYKSCKAAAVDATPSESPRDRAPTPPAGERPPAQTTPRPTGSSDEA